jgi:hypothetical protein
MTNTLSTYWGDGEYSDRRAEVCRDDRGFYVQFFMNDQFIEFRTLYEHSERYAEDAAENWCLGIIT